MCSAIINVKVHSSCFAVCFNCTICGIFIQCQQKKNTTQKWLLRSFYQLRSMLWSKINVTGCSACTGVCESACVCAHACAGRSASGQSVIVCVASLIISCRTLWNHHGPWEGKNSRLLLLPFLMVSHTQSRLRVGVSFILLALISTGGSQGSTATFMFYLGSLCLEISGLQTTVQSSHTVAKML